MNLRLPALSSLVGTLLLVAACGGATSNTPTANSKVPTPAQTLVQPTATAQPTTAPTLRKEVTLVKAARAPIAATVDALAKNDLEGARREWAQYDPLWNGMEIYINYRSLPTYQDLETNYQAKINQAMAAADAKPAEILPVAKAMLSKYDEAIKLVEGGAPISSMFDDVADIRIARQPLRQVTPALNAGDLAKAKTLFDSFSQNWPTVSPLFKLRSETAFQETDQAITQVKAAWQKPQPSVTELTSLVATVTNRYGFGLNLVTTAARKSDLSKPAFHDEDVQAVGGVRAIQAELRASLSSWNAGNHAEASTHANRAGSELFNSASVAGPLKAKALDAAFKSNLDAYVAMAGSAGDQAKVAAANKAAIEAGEIAIQGLVGQFWTDTKLAPAIAAATPK